MTVEKRGSSNVLEVSDWNLLVFVDETGHEEMKGSSMFGFGACACRSSDYEASIARPWREIVRRNFGNEPQRMHAAELRETPEQIEALSTFFRESPFHRLGVSIKKGASIEVYESSVGACLDQLFALTSHVLDVCDPVIAVQFMFEESDRLRSSIERHDSPRSIKSVFKRDRVPANYRWLPKASLEPGLQVADFVAHAIHGQVTRGHPDLGYRSPRKDFEAVFSPEREALNHYFEIESIRLA